MFDWMSAFIRASGYPGIALMMLAENVFPPIPSELIMPLAGFLAARGDLSLTLAILAGGVGSLAGACLWFWIGARLGAERLHALADRHGRWLTMSRRDVDTAHAWFDRHGGRAVMLGRLVPTVRTLISVPAGIAGMGFARFLALSAIGTLVWTAVLAVAGYQLQNGYGRVAQYMEPVSNVVVGAIVLAYIYRVVTFHPGR